MTRRRFLINSVAFVVVLLSWHTFASGQDRFSKEDHKWMDPLDAIAIERGYLARPDYEPAGAPYRTVMTYTKMITKYDSITILLAQNRKDRNYFVLVFDLADSIKWSSEAVSTYRDIERRIRYLPMQMTRADSRARELRLRGRAH